MVAGDYRQGFESTNRTSAYTVKGLAFVAGLLTALLLAYLPTTALLVSAWANQSGYSHGLLVFVVAAWLIWRQMEMDGVSPSAPSLALISLTGVASLTWLVGYVSATQLVQMLALVVLAFCVVAAAFDPERPFRYLIPAGVVLFSVPVWDVATPTLQALTIEANSAVLSWLGWTAYLDGDIVHVKAGSFHIEEGCSGTHFFVVALTLGTLYAHLYSKTLVGRLTMILAAGCIAILANWIRVFALIVVGDVTDMQHFLIQVDHYYFGWVVFALAMIPLFILGRYVQGREQAVDSGAEPSAAAGPRPSQAAGTRLKRVSGLAALALLVLVPPAYAVFVVDRLGGDVDADLDLPGSIGAWQSALSGDDVLPRPSFVGAQAEAARVYGKDGYELQLYANRYTQQSQGAELVGYQNAWYGRPWQSASNAAVLRETVDGSPQEFVVEEVARDGSQRRSVVIRTYVVGNRLVASDREAKLRTAFAMLLGDAVSGTITVAIGCGDDCANARQEALQFFGEAAPAIVPLIKQKASPGTPSKIPAEEL